ncbi:gamma-tubulin complex component 3 [Tanacetum coccineum]
MLSPPPPPRNSITPDESSLALSIKTLLVKQSKSSDALSFADLYFKFSNKTSPGSVKNSESLRDVAYREYGVIVKEENNVTEEVLVRDVLYVCQWIDGRYVLFDKSVDGYILPDSIKVRKSVRVMVRKLCELGWLFRKVKWYVYESVERLCDEDVGTVGQAFCAALQDELGEYYKLLAVLQAQAMNVTVGVY